MRLTTAIATGCTVLMLGSWTSAFQSGSSQPPTSGQAGGAAGNGDPSSHGTTDRAGQSAQPVGTGGTAVEQGKGGTGRPTKSTSDKKGKRKPKHGTTTTKGGGSDR